jgi:hypothetical protein
MAISFQGAPFPKEVRLMGVRWYVAYPLSTRHVEALMQERGVDVDHSTINRWTIQYSPLLKDACHRRKRPVGEYRHSGFALDREVHAPLWIGEMERGDPVPLPSQSPHAVGGRPWRSRQVVRWRPSSGYCVIAAAMALCTRA